ncbi:UNVERIFIED_CONTAM: hypothetical protein HHA_450720 [Hammondia hammondi]|eukprot:XP_008883142.1 hypothetical protein HHA_450720 [Hammondia hammondi]
MSCCGEVPRHGGEFDDGDDAKEKRGRDRREFRKQTASPAEKRKKARKSMPENRSFSGGSA